MEFALTLMKTDVSCQCKKNSSHLKGNKDSVLGAHKRRPLKQNSNISAVLKFKSVHESLQT